MGREGIEQLLFIMDSAFEGGALQQQPLLKNLAAVRDDDWLWVPPGGKRSIFDIVDHMGAMYAYENSAFCGKVGWQAPDGITWLARTATRAEAVEWLREAHRRWRSHVAALPDDAALMEKRKTPWGQETTTRWLINVMIQHDLYHAGEINHIRALHQGNDA